MICCKPDTFPGSHGVKRQAWQDGHTYWELEFCWFELDEYGTVTLYTVNHASRIEGWNLTVAYERHFDSWQEADAWYEAMVQDPLRLIVQAQL